MASGPAPQARFKRFLELPFLVEAEWKHAGRQKASIDKRV